MNDLTKIRGLAIGKANRLQRCHRHLADLLPAFAQWSAGEIYICRKTGDYRFRFGEHSKSIAPWSTLARQLFPTPAAFAFAAVVLGDEAPAESAGDTAHLSSTAAVLPATRANVIALAQQQAA